jgi:hypothetical protein
VRRAVNYFCSYARFGQRFDARRSDHPRSCGRRLRASSLSSHGRTGGGGTHATALPVGKQANFGQAMRVVLELARGRVPPCCALTHPWQDLAAQHRSPGTDSFETRRSISSPSRGAIERIVAMRFRLRSGPAGGASRNGLVTAVVCGTGMQRWGDRARRQPELCSELTTSSVSVSVARTRVSGRRVAGIAEQQTSWFDRRTQLYQRPVAKFGFDGL